MRSLPKDAASTCMLRARHYATTSKNPVISRSHRHASMTVRVCGRQSRLHPHGSADQLAGGYDGGGRLSALAGEAPLVSIGDQLGVRHVVCARPAGDGGGEGLGLLSRRSTSIRKARFRPQALPRPASLTVNLRNDHLQYAVTWFGLAAVLVGCFVAWRLTGRRSSAEPGDEVHIEAQELSKYS